MDDNERKLELIEKFILDSRRQGRLRPSVNAHLAESFDLGEPLPGTRCMRDWCSEPRWKHPVKGELVLCQEHAGEVVRGEAKAPPLRRNLDYVAVGRKTFLADPLPGDPKDT